MELDIDLVITKFSETVLRVGQELQVEFILACKAPLSTSKKFDHQLQFIVQHIQPPLKQALAVVNTAEIAAILEPPPLVPSKQLNTAPPTDIIPGASLDNLRLPPPYDDDLPSSIDSDLLTFLGSSIQILPILRLDPIPGQDKGQGQIEFTLRYTALHSGFTAVGGLRVFVIEDLGAKNTARLIRKWDTVADVWIRP